MNGFVPFRETPGKSSGHQIELSTGRVVDESGKTVNQLVPREDMNDALSDFAARLNYSHLAATVGHPVRMRDADGESVAITMDLSVGDAHYDQPLTNFAGGYKLGDGIADIAAPVVVTAKTGARYNVWDSANAFKRVIPNASAPGAAVPEISPTLSTGTFQTVEYALASFVPTEVEANADAPLNIMQACVRRVMTALRLEREIRVANMLQTSGNWDSSVVKTIAAGAKWNGGASSDPIADIHAIVEASLTPISRIVMSELAAHAFMRNGNVQKYIAYKPGAEPLPNIGQLSALLSLPPMIVAPMKYFATGTTPSYLWGNHVVLLHTPATNPPVDQESIATAYTFRWNGGTTPDGSMTSGWLTRTFFDPKRGPRGGTQVVCVHNDAEVMTSKLAGGLLLNAIQ